MGTAVGVEGNVEAKVANGVATESRSDESGPTAMKHVSDPYPFVYQLVRVDGDGRLVPATDDEVMVVEDLLRDDKTQVHFAVDGGEQSEVTRSEGCPSEKSHFNRSEGQCENLEADGGNTNIQPGLAVDLGKTNAQQQETANQLDPQSDGSNSSQSRNIEGCSSSQAGSYGKGSATSAVSSSSKPDFSKLKGEICLDNLTVKELQETFRATFGRETSVKDKQWLKRRIVMGLTNSCDFSTTTFLIEDNKVVKKSKAESYKRSAAVKGPVTGIANEIGQGLSFGCDKRTKDHLNFDTEKPHGTLIEYNSANEDPNAEQRAAKRVRKPTKRYIEEIEEISEGESRESSGRLISSVKSSDHMQPCSKNRMRPVPNVRPDGTPVVTRQDSLGGSGVQVPYVSRVRRGRPRENFMTLMKLQPRSTDMATKMVNKAFGEPGSPLNDERANKVLKARLSSAWIQQPLITASESGKHYLVRSSAELDKDTELERMDSFEDNLDDNMAVLPTPTGGMRRKHHRPWSLTEVVKLVEGVARHGAGRWSEIKRFAFASYSYRTSVDLKDKWRNLLRASFAQLPAEKGMQNSRKHASIPIPAPILLRVRELAEMQAQVPPNLSSSKLAAQIGGSDRSIDEARSGFL